MRTYRRTKILLLCLLPVVALLSTLAPSHADNAAQRAWVTIISTTDLHGNIAPLDYYTNKPDARGLAKAATIIAQIRKENPAALLLDSGDTIQGTPLVYYHNKLNNAPIDPMMLTMNTLRYDAMAVGNHEYNFGLAVLNKARSEAKFPWLSANTYRKGTDETAYQPYLIKESNGVRVGILGLTTPGIPNWENKENYAGLEFREPVSEAKKWVAVLRGKERVDLVVIAMHMGLEADLRTGEVTPGQVTHENEAIAIAKQVPGIDVILMGHTHREVSALYINSEQATVSVLAGAEGPPQRLPDYFDSVLLTQANRWASHVARVDVYLEKAAQDGRWRVTAKAARTLPVEAAVPAAEIMQLVAPYDRETQSWLNHVIGDSSVELSAQDARLRDNALLDLIQRVQLDAGHADVSMAASFNPSAHVARGQVTVRDIAALYEYENTLVVIEVTGQQLKDALEHAAKYFKAYVPGKPAADLVDEKIPGYNFDIAEGVDYDLDIAQPVGQRIKNLRFRGQPLSMTQKLKLATNNYRVNGGGGYTMYRGAPELFRSSEEIRELIIAWVEQHKRIPPEPTHNWRLLP